MLPVSLVPMSYATTDGAPPAPAAAALAAVPGNAALTAQAAPPAIGAPITGNQRQPGDGAIRTALEEGALALAAPNVPSPNVLGSVQRDFGNSSAFLAQFIDQTGLADTIKFQPSQAGEPPPPQPMLDLARSESPPPQNTAQPALTIPPAANQNATVSGQNEAALNAYAAPEREQTIAPARTETALALRPQPARSKAGQAYHASQQRLAPRQAQHAGFDPVDSVA